MSAFQVFLSYKHTGEDGNLTSDAVMAEELYSELTKRNINVFYSDRTIQRLGEAKYKMAIDDALDEASVLVAIGTSADNLNSNWVRYEWDSFYGDILSGRKNGQMISYIEGMNLYDLPRTLRQLQSFNRSQTSTAEICDFICSSLSISAETIYCPSNCRIISLKELEARGVTALEAEIAFSENDKLLYEGIPDEVAGTAEQWAGIIQKYPDYTGVVVDDNNNIFGNYTMAGLTAREEGLMERGELVDAGMSADKSENVYVAGSHTGYLLNLSVNPSSESSELYRGLWNHFIEMLKRMAREEQVFFSKIYYKAFLTEHEAKVAARGFRFCCKDKYFGNVYVHDMDPNSTLKALDPELAEIYADLQKEAGVGTTNNSDLIEIDALSAYMDLWRQIEELFYQPEYCRLKKYFMGGKGIPQNTVEYKMGLAVCEWIRDNLQYSESLLPFIPEEQQKTHRQYKDRIYNSEIIRDFLKHYQYIAEDESWYDTETQGFSVNALITFAQIWLDIDRLFMIPELLEYKQYFYENRDKLPPDEDMEICEMLTVRILSVFRISEVQLKQLPGEYVESYYNYKNMVCSSMLAKRVLNKIPFLKRELYK